MEPLYTDTKERNKQKKVLKGRFWSRADNGDNIKDTILGKAVLREMVVNRSGIQLYSKSKTAMRNNATVCIPQWGDADASHLVRTQS